MNHDEHDDAGLALDVQRLLLNQVPQPRGGHGARNSDQVQVDVGGYQIFQVDTGRVIAELYVGVDPLQPSNEKVLIEHWGLYPAEGWVTPSETNPEPPPLALKRVNGTYWSNLEAFLGHLRTKANVTYIVARCETKPVPPPQ